MTYIKIILILGIISILLFFLGNPHNMKIRASKKIVGVLFVITGVLFILFPGWSNRIAHSLGVSRGADLMFYAFIIAFIFVSLNFYIGMMREGQRVTVLARKVAILEAELNQKKRKTSRKSN